MSCSAPYGSLVVAKKSYLNQSSSTSAVTIYTPSDDEDLIVSCSAEGLSGIDVSITLSWTDGTGTSRTHSLGNGDVYAIHAKASNTVQTAYVSGAGLTCNAYISLVEA